jgi:phage baseplate assembly protein W
MYGADIKLDGNGDFIWDCNQDFLLIEGRDNLSQAIIDLLQTGLGELEFHLQYGSRVPSIVGSNNIQLTLTELRQAIRETLNQEPRIQTINSIRLQFNGVDEIKVFITVTPINSVEPLNIIYPIFLNQ